MIKPNLFRIATKELSQDGFFTWLLQWADVSNEQFDKELHQTAKSFISLLLDNKPIQISKVTAERQWNNIDIWVKVNEDTFIAIEDKTNTGEHSEQLERYKQIVAEHYKDKRKNLFFVYLKTGNESIVTLKKVKKKEYTVIDRKAILNILNNCNSKNNILLEFRDNLNDIEAQTNSYDNFENIISNWKTAEGFFIRLQEMILPKCSDWQYVANQTGGFLGFWLNGIKCNNYCLHIQIENAFDYGMRLVIKIDNWEPNIDTMYSVLSKLQSEAQDIEITVVKPDRFRTGKTSTLAIIKNVFPVDTNSNIEISEIVNILKKVEKLLETHCVNQKK